MSFKKTLFALCFGLLVTAQAESSAQVVGYYPYWVQYSQFYPKDIRYNMLTQIHYVGAIPAMNGALALVDESDAANFAALAKSCTEKRVGLMLVVGGMEAEAMLKEISGNEEALSSFTAAVAEWIQKYNLAGIELDWQNLIEEDKVAYTKLVSSLSNTVKAVGAKLSLSVYPQSVAAYETASLSFADYLTVFVPEQMTAEESQLKPNQSIQEMSAAISALVGAGAEKSKLVPVLSLSAKTFLGATGLGSAHQGVGSGNEGYISYRELIDQTFNGKDYKVEFDENSQSEIAVGVSQAIVFSGIPSAKALATRVKSENLAGIALYDISQDHKEPIVSLLVTVGQILRPEVNYTVKKK